MDIHLRKFDWSDRWYAVWHDGERSQRVSTRTSDPAEAERFVARLKQSLSAAPSKITVDWICAGYLKDRERAGVAALASLKYALTPIREKFGSYTPDLITKQEIWDYVDQRRVAPWILRPGQKSRPLGRKESTINKEVRTLRQALKWAIVERHLDRMPPFEIPPEGASRYRWITLDRALELIDAAVSPHIRIFIALGFFTGARKTAVLQLHWDPQVDMANRMIDYRKANVAYRAKRRGIVAINNRLYAELERAKKIATTNWVIEYAGEPLKDIKTGFRLTCERIGLEDFHPHDMRHSFCTWLVQKSVSYDEIGRIVGDTAETIRRVYGHHDPKQSTGPVGLLD